MSAKRMIVMLLFGFLALFIQGSVLKSLGPESMIVPNLILILVIFLAFYEVSVAGVFTAFLLGLQMDLGTGILLGPWAASFVAAYGFVSSVSQRVFVESPVAVAAVTFCSSLLVSFAVVAFVFQFRPAALDAFSYSLTMLLEGLLTAVIAPFLFSGLKRMLVPRGGAAGRP